MQRPITRDEVVSSSEQLPVFPRVVTRILAALENPDAGLHTLAGCIEHDPVITARVLSLANRAGTHKRVSSPFSDVFTAISLIGLAQVRQTRQPRYGTASRSAARCGPALAVPLSWRHLSTGRQ